MLNRVRILRPAWTGGALLVAGIMLAAGNPANACDGKKKAIAGKSGCGENIKAIVGLAGGNALAGKSDCSKKCKTAIATGLHAHAHAPCDHKGGQDTRTVGGVFAVPVGDRGNDRLGERIERMEHRLAELEARLVHVIDALERRHDGRSEHAIRVPMPPSPPTPPGLYTDLTGRYTQARENWSEQFHELQHEWGQHQREAMEYWHQALQEQMGEFREQQQEFAQEMREWGREFGEHARELAHEKAEQSRELARELADRARDAQRGSRKAKEKSAARSRGRSAALPKADKQPSKQVTYNVAGEQADMLYDLLAPSYVKVVVSRQGKNIGVRGTAKEHKVLNAALQLLDWTDRDDLFRQMTEGERRPKTYRLGPERAEKMFEMLAPNSVRVIVSNAGDDAVSIQATKKEHKVLADFLALLHWDNQVH